MTNENKLFNRVPYRYIIRGLWAGALFGVLSLAGLFIYVASTKMPDTQDLENPIFEKSSIVYDINGEELDRYFQRNRQWIKYEDLSQNLVDALIATEDLRFFKHSGIDARSTGRAVVFMGGRGGASTITQQLAKQFFTEKRSSNFGKRLWQKMKEWVIAVEFERRYTKEEILAMFLNKFDFNYQANGVGSAAKIYFGKSQNDLDKAEAAVLVGMLKSPSIYNPVYNPEQSLRRRNIVLSQMRKNNFIGEEEYEVERSKPLDMSKFNRGENYSGYAPHFMSELKKYVRKILKDNDITKPGGEKFNLDTDGLEIITTLDASVQKHAEAAARRHMQIQQEKFWRVWKNKDPWEHIETDGLTKKEIANIKRIRQSKLNELIELTPRYRSLRKAYLSSISKDIVQHVPNARLWNGDIHRMLKAEKDKDYLDGLIDRKYISDAQKDTYLQILASEYWPEVKRKWQELNEATIRTFNAKRKMEVYDLTGSKVVEMSPLDSIKYMASFLQMGAISMDPSTGYVKSWVGGTDYEIWKYDHVTSNRQVGSTFKPFLYTAALNNRMSPCWKVRDMQYSIPAKEEPFQLMKSWSPKNSRGEFSDEEVTLKEALKLSLNSASVYLVKQLESVAPIISVAGDMGIDANKIPPYPSLVLGSATLSVLEMTAAYATYANNGVSSQPIFVKEIRFGDRVIYREQPLQKRTLAEDVNYAMVDLLKHASSGVSSLLHTEFGGKTGTTNDHVDGWYMGITPGLVTGTWVGGEYNWIRFLSLNEGQGSRMARPYFIDFMQRLEKDKDIDIDWARQFQIPETFEIVVDCDVYESEEKESLSDEFEMD